MNLKVAFAFFVLVAIVGTLIALEPVFFGITFGMFAVIGMLFWAILTILEWWEDR